MRFARLTITASFVYVRFHGLAGGAAHDYTDGELRPWAKFLRSTAQKGIDGFVYFNNDVNMRAPSNALLLIELVGPFAVSVRPTAKEGFTSKTQRTLTKDNG
jgi:uncharacterized protein YecE (DUF72 family)